eukprot:5806438-Pyramimonas_sp.AAC.1
MRSDDNCHQGAQIISNQDLAPNWGSKIQTCSQMVPWASPATSFGCGALGAAFAAPEDQFRRPTSFENTARLD